MEKYVVFLQAYSEYALPVWFVALSLYLSSGLKCFRSGQTTQENTCPIEKRKMKINNDEQLQ